MAVSTGSTEAAVIPFAQHTLHLVDLCKGHLMWISLPDFWNWPVQINDAPFFGTRSMRCPSRLSRAPQLVWAEVLLRQLQRFVPDELGVSPMQGPKSIVVPADKFTSIYDRLCSLTDLHVYDIRLTEQQVVDIELAPVVDHTQWAVICACDRAVVSLAPDSEYIEGLPGGPTVLTLHLRRRTFSVFRIPPWVRTFSFFRHDDEEANVVLMVFARRDGAAAEVLEPISVKPSVASNADAAAPDPAADPQPLLVRRCDTSFMYGIRDRDALMVLGRRAKNDELEYSSSVVPPAGIPNSLMALAYYLNARVNGELLKATPSAVIEAISNRLMMLEVQKRKAAQQKQKLQSTEHIKVDTSADILMPMMPHNLLCGVHMQMRQPVVVRAKAPTRTVSLLYIHNLMARFIVYMAHARAAGMLMGERIADEVPGSSLRDIADVFVRRSCSGTGITVELGRVILTSPMATAASGCRLTELAVKLAEIAPGTEVPTATQSSCISAYVLFAIYSVLVSLVSQCDPALAHIGRMKELITPETSRATHDAMYAKSDIETRFNEKGGSRMSNGTDASYCTYSSFLKVVGLLNSVVPGVVVDALDGIDRATKDMVKNKLAVEPDPKQRRRAPSTKKRERDEPAQEAEKRARSVTPLVLDDEEDAADVEEEDAEEKTDEPSRPNIGSSLLAIEPAATSQGATVYRGSRKQPLLFINQSN